MLYILLSAKQFINFII